jgi:uncharacterized Ntn-hydrolase superfamily protein
MTPSAACLTLVTLLGLVAGTPRPASATWSIVAVDPRTREVGAAGASCTPFVVGILGLAPGRGAIVVQAMSNPMARVRGVEMLNDGATPAAIIRTLREPQFDPENQQYGVAALGADSGAAYTGTAAYAESATAHGAGVAVQGNTLPSKEVVHAAMAAFRAAADSGLPLAERLLRALEAGSAAGGDRRCGRQAAHSAFLGVARPGDAPRNPYVRLIIPDQEDTGINPVHLLRGEYERQRTQTATHRIDARQARPRCTICSEAWDDYLGCTPTPRRPTMAVWTITPARTTSAASITPAATSTGSRSGADDPGPTRVRECSRPARRVVQDSARVGTVSRAAIRSAVRALALRTG